MDPTAVSADGTTVVGSATFADGVGGGTSEMAFRWRPHEGFQPLGMVLSGTRSAAYAVSRDGSVIAGGGRGSLGYDVGFRKQGDGGNLPVFDLNSPNPGPDATVTALSADGTVLAGYHRDRNDYVRSFFWTWNGQNGGTFEDLGEVLVGSRRSNGIQFNRINGLSADGRYAAGWSNSALTHTGRVEAFRYDHQTDTALGLGFLQNEGIYRDSSADAISEDGATVVGTARTNLTGVDGPEFFYWTEAGGLQRTGRLFSPGEVIRLALSGDGHLLVSSSEQRAGYWSLAGGWSFLDEEVPELIGWQYTVATAVNRDGTVIAGWGFPAGGGTSSGQEVAWLIRRRAAEPPAQLRMRAEWAAGGLRLRVEGLPEGYRGEVQSSPDLRQWTVWQVVTGASSGAPVVVAAPGEGSALFYRLRWVQP